MRMVLFQRIRKIVAWYIATTAVIMFMLLLPCCDKPQSSDEPLTVEGMIAHELKMQSHLYEERFGESFPSCVDCSDLERLLIIERANRRRPPAFEMPPFQKLYDRPSQVPYIETPYITKDKRFEKRLMEVGEEYKERFGRTLPWWWVCSDEEKIERVERAFEVGAPYPKYFNKYATAYRLGKAIAGYEMWFKREPPKFEGSDKEHLTLLESAINAESPLLTPLEKAALRAEYFEKFKRPITDVEFSIMKVSLAKIYHTEVANPQTSVIRTAIGAIALYQPSAGDNDIVSINPGSIELSLSLDEWLDFINAFHEYVDSWEKMGCGVRQRGHGPLDPFWELKLFFAVTDTLIANNIRRPFDECPLDWDGLIEFMGGMEAKIKENGQPRQPKK